MFDAHYRGNGHHGAAAAAHAQVFDVADLLPVSGIGLDHDAIHAAELVEVVDIHGAEVGLQGLEDLLHGNALNLGL
ncbi:hypothetical protein D9M70_552190 [compost metagenome]